MQNEEKKREERIRRLTSDPLYPLLVRMAIPSMVGMAVSTVYSMTDTFFVGKLDNVALTASVGIVFSFVSVIQAIGFWFGYGSGNYISRCLGKGDIKSAEKMAATGVLLAILTGILIMIAGLPLTGQLARLLGAEQGELFDATVRYLRISYIAYALVIGFGQGFQPVCAINYGAGKYDRIRRAFKLTLLTVTFFLVLSVAVLWSAAGMLAGGFSRETDVVSLAARFIRAHCVILPFMGYYVLSGMFLQNIGRFAEATLVTVSENGLFLILSVLILPRVLGMDGLVWCRPAASLAALGLSLIIGIRAWRKYVKE